MARHSNRFVYFISPKPLFEALRQRTSFSALEFFIDLILNYIIIHSLLRIINLNLKKDTESLNILADLKMYSRFAWGLRGFLRHTISLEEATPLVQQRMAEREENFLRLVKKGIFGYPKSPYLPLLKLARCEMGDIENMVRDRKSTRL